MLGLTSPELAAAADGLIAGTRSRGAYEGAFDAAAESLSATIRTTAGDPLFREAVTWQNRSLVTNCLDKAVKGEPRNVRGRNHELAITGHLQRYALKNDTIGFFGPVGWASLTDSADALTVEPGERLLARRTVYFETWAVDALARAFAADPAVLPWLVPARDNSSVLRQGLLHRPDRLPLPVTGAEAAVLALCDGKRTARELAAEPSVRGTPGLESERAVLGVLTDLRDRELIWLDLEGPVEAWPEDTLRKKLERIDDPVVQERLTGMLERVIEARDAVGAAGGDAEQLGAAIDRLNAVFREFTGEEAVRHHGRTYAGRTLVYEDTVRDVRAELGQPFLDELAGPMGLVLDSARWLLGRIGEEYQALFRRLYTSWSAKNGSEEMPLSRLLGAATPYLYFQIGALPAPVRAAVAAFQDRWADVLGEAADDEPRNFSAGELAERMRALFPATPPAWATAVHHAPDLMIAAESPEAVARGEYLTVLGELHTSFNSLESRLFVEQHACPDWVRSADAADHGDRRIYLIPPKDWSSVTSRLAPPSATLSPHYTYWSLRRPSVDASGPVASLVSLYVHLEDGELVVRERGGSFRAGLLEMLSEPLSNVSVNAFKPLRPAARRPRVTIDRLVLSRASWTVRAADIDWVRTKNERDRFLRARAWRASRGLPERVFFTSPTEPKPIFLDFSSIPLVNAFCKVARQAADQATDATLGLSEMLPDLDQAWLRDAAGERYTSEIRVIVKDPLR
ncbi:lantibiotic dehydratase [Streptomyces sp. NPDC006372]|uniref:lantibiotic dehydratase n=1 Tax=Streptomyces sp. NPDC006372 TaxID=3155599 RepID=UPI0033A8F582